MRSSVPMYHALHLWADGATLRIADEVGRMRVFVWLRGQPHPRWPEGVSVSLIDLKAAVSEDIGGALVIALEGELDMASGPLLDDWVAMSLDSGGRSLVLDLRELTFVDSMGLRALVHADTAARKCRGRLVLRSPRPQVRALLQITGLDRRLDIEG